jgi:purine-binding chemotaxis protein CheW
VDEPQRSPERRLSEDAQLNATMTLATHQSQHLESILLFHCADRQLGVSALDVHATVPRCAILPSPLRGGICQGVIQHHGREVPVVDTLALLGLGRMPQVNEAALLILRFPGQGLLGLLLDGVSDILRIAPSQTLRIPSLAVPQAALFRFALDLRTLATEGSSGSSGPQALVLDVSALHRQANLAGLASLAGASQDKAAPTRKADQSLSELTRRDAAGSRPYLYFQSSGQGFACPLAQISEILPFTAADLARTSTEAHVLGMMAHRGETLTVICLAAVLACRPPEDASKARVLVINTEHEQVGFAVEGLRAIAPGRALAGNQSATTSSSLPAIAYAKSLVEIDVEGMPHSVPTMDLAQLAATLLTNAQQAQQNQLAQDPRDRVIH